MTGLIFPHSKLLKGAGTVDPVSITQTDNDQRNANGTSATFSNIAIGAAAADRIVCICAAAEGGDDITSCNIDGTPMTMHGQARDTSPSPDTGCAIFTYPWPTGTTATITLFVSTSDDTGICASRIVGGNGVVSDVDEDTSSTTSVVTIPENGAGVMVCAANSDPSMSADNCTELDTFSGNGGDSIWCGYKLSATELVNEEFGCSGASTSNCCTAAFAIG